MSSSTRTTIISSKGVAGSSGGRISGGGGGSSVSTTRHTSLGTSSRTGGGFSCRSYGGSYGGGGCAGGGFSGGSCGRLSYCGYGGGTYGGFGSSCGGFGGFGGAYGGSFGGGSLGGAYGFSGSGFGGDDAGILSNNEKVTMQNLNDRLAAYLNKVRSLEEENAQLERLIREWYQRQGPTGPLKNYSPYYGEIEGLNTQIINSNVELNKILVATDNTRMTIDDFKQKYETELGLRQNVEADINGLRSLLDQLTLNKSDLEIEFESLTEELTSLRKNHEEELRGLQSQSSGDVNVEVNTSPGFDLTGRLNELRHEYEQIIENNRKELERWYEIQIKEVNQQVHVNGKEIETNNHQVSELRREYQNLEIELQSQLSMIQSLQSSLDDTEQRYNLQLQQIQNIIVPVENELASIRCEIENQNQEYRVLLGIKTRLEQEIAQYRNLLDEGQKDIVITHGGDIISSGGRGGGTYGSGGISSGGSRSVISSGGRSGGSLYGSGGISSGGGVISSGGGTGGESGRVSASGSSSSTTYSSSTHVGSSQPSKSIEGHGYARKSFD